MLEHENNLTIPDFTLTFPRLQAVEEDYTVLEVLISRTDVPCSQHKGTTEAEILRKALDLLLAREGIGENEDRFADLIGLFAGPSEVDHDDIYR